MDSKVIYDIIRNTVQGCLPGSRILLFGSRARGDYDSRSDYDLLVITPNLLTRTEKLSWSRLLDKVLIRAIHAPVDLLLYSEEEISEKQALFGHIVRTAVREGVAL